EERGEARRPEVPTALVKRALRPAEDVALAAVALSAERDAKQRRELARALQRLGECARVEEREGARHLGDALPPQEPLLCRLEESRPPRGVLPGAPLDLLAQPHGVGPDIRAREDPSPLPEGRGREAEPHRVRALEGRHDERAAVLKMPRYIVRKPEQNKAFTVSSEKSLERARAPSPQQPYPLRRRLRRARESGSARPRASSPRATRAAARPGRRARGCSGTRRAPSAPPTAPARCCRGGARRGARGRSSSRPPLGCVPRTPPSRPDSRTRGTPSRVPRASRTACPARE